MHWLHQTILLELLQKFFRLAYRNYSRDSSWNISQGNTLVYISWTSSKTSQWILSEHLIWISSENLPEIPSKKSSSLYFFQNFLHKFFQGALWGLLMKFVQKFFQNCSWISFINPFMNSLFFSKDSGGIRRGIPGAFSRKKI